jgi:hypothetical protein
LPIFGPSLPLIAEEQEGELIEGGEREIVKDAEGDPNANVRAL